MPTALFCYMGYKGGPLQPLQFTTRSYMSAIQILLIVITILFAVGIITCVLSHYKMGARSWSDQRNRQQPTTRQYHQPCPQPQYTYSLTPTTTSTMYTSATMQEQQRLQTGALHDHLVRLHSVQTDLALNLPHSIALPDGEEGPNCDTRLLKLHDEDQHAEITRSFIRPPPNRTVPEGNIIPPLRSNSVGQKPVLNYADTILVVRSQSVSTSNGQSSKGNYPKGQTSAVLIPAVTPQVRPPPTAMNSHASAAIGFSNRTYGCTQAVTDSKYDSTDPPPPYSDVVNKWDVSTVNKQQNNGV